MQRHSSIILVCFQELQLPQRNATQIHMCMYAPCPYTRVCLSICVWVLYVNVLSGGSYYSQNILSTLIALRIEITNEDFF